MAACLKCGESAAGFLDRASWPPVGNLDRREFCKLCWHELAEATAGKGARDAGRILFLRIVGANGADPPFGSLRIPRVYGDIEAMALTDLTADDPMEVATGHELADARIGVLGHLLNRSGLRARAREVVERHYGLNGYCGHEQSDAAIARSLGCSKQNVEQTFGRAHERMRREIKRMATVDLF